MLTKFRERYPQGSLVSELVKIDRGMYIVKALVQIDNIVLATGLAAADKIEQAEDKARERAIATLALDLHQTAVDNLKTEKLAVNSTPDKLSNSEQMPSVLANMNSNSSDNNDSTDLSKPSPAIEPETSTAKIEPTIVSEPPTPEPFLEPENPEINLNSEPVISYGNLFEGTAAKEQYGNPLANNNDITSQLPTSNINLNPESEATETIDFNEIKQKTDIEIKRLGWTKDDGREFLKTRYGKRSRLHLTDEQLLEFLRYLEKEPTLVK